MVENQFCRVFAWDGLCVGVVSPRLCYLPLDCLPVKGDDEVSHTCRPPIANDVHYFRCMYTGE